jgi:hypothetical protein
MLLILESPALDTAPLLDVLGQHVAGEVAVATSIDAALSTIDHRMPDVILLPALMPPADEDHLMAYLGALSSAGHVQAIKVPLLEGSPPVSSTQSFFAKRQKRAGASMLPHATPRAFAGEVAAYLACASQRKEEIQERRTSPSRGFERRDSPRWSPDEVPWVSMVQFAGGHEVDLINLSMGGALLRTHARPDRHSLRRVDPHGPERPLLTFRLESGDEIRAAGRVVRCCIVGGPTSVEYELALRFDQSVAPVLPADLAVVGSAGIECAD